MADRPLRLGTRGSALALAQSGGVAATVLAQLGREVELVPVVTEGDRSRAAVPALGSTGVFVTALRDALREGRVDLAVHSYKDLPTAPADGLVIAAVPPREDARDVLVARDGLTLGELPAGSRVGTGAPRRAAQLRALGLGLQVLPLRGNVDTRLRRVADGELDAVVLARAGLARLDRLAEVTETLDPLQVLPAPAQGALALECRADDAEVHALLALLDDPASRATVAAERALLAALEAGCSAPVAALAELSDADPGDPPGPGAEPADRPGAGAPGTGPLAGQELFLRGLVAAVDGSDVVRLSAAGAASDPAAVGRRLAAELLDAGAAVLLPAAPAPP